MEMFINLDTGQNRTNLEAKDIYLNLSGTNRLGTLRFFLPDKELKWLKLLTTNKYKLEIQMNSESGLIAVINTENISLISHEIFVNDESIFEHAVCFKFLPRIRYFSNENGSVDFSTDPSAILDQEWKKSIE